MAAKTSRRKTGTASARSTSGSRTKAKTKTKAKAKPKAKAKLKSDAKSRPTFWLLSALYQNYSRNWRMSDYSWLNKGPKLTSGARKKAG